MQQLPLIDIALTLAFPCRVSEAAPSSHHVPTLPLTSLKTGGTSGRHVLQSSTKENLSASVAPEGATNRISNNDMIDLERRCAKASNTPSTSSFLQNCGLTSLHLILLLLLRDPSYGQTVF